VTDEGVTFRLHRDLSLRIGNIPPSIRGGRIGITIYGVLPGGKPFLIGKTAAKLDKDTTIRINPKNLYAYAKAWLNWAKRHNIDPETIEPPGDILIAITVPGKGVYTAMTGLPTRIDLIAKGFTPVVNIDLTRLRPEKVIDWSKKPINETTKTGKAEPQEIITCTPPRCIVVDKTHFWLATSSQSYDLVHLPVVLIHLNGPDIYQINSIHLMMYLYTDSYRKLNIYFSGPAIKYKAGFVDIEKPSIPDYTFAIRNGRVKTTALLSLRVYNNPSEIHYAMISEFITGTDYEKEVANFANNNDNYVAIGIMANVTYINYTLFHCKNEGAGIGFCGPTKERMYRTYIIPDVVRDNDGTQSIFMWYEINTDTSYKGAAEKAFEVLEESNETRITDLGAHDGGIGIDAATVQREYASNPILSVSGGVPVLPDDVPFGPEISLFSIGIAEENSAVSVSVVLAIINVRSEYAMDGYCETWPGLYITKDKLTYFDRDRGYVGSYPLTTMSFDVFMWSWPCQS